MEETWWGIIMVLVLYSILFATVSLGHWSWLFQYAVDWFPFWHWGG